MARKDPFGELMAAARQLAEAAGRLAALGTVWPAALEAARVAEGIAHRLYDPGQKSARALRDAARALREPGRESSLLSPDEKGRHAEHIRGVLAHYIVRQGKGPDPKMLAAIVDLCRRTGGCDLFPHVAGWPQALVPAMANALERSVDDELDAADLAEVFVIAAGHAAGVPKPSGWFRREGMRAKRAAARDGVPDRRRRRARANGS